jgi:hypothetical protein
VESTIGGLAGHAGSSDGFGGLAQFNGPQGLVVDSAGNVYVADTENNTIRRGAPAIIPTVQVLSTIRGSVSLASAAVAGSRYQVQYTTSLSSPNWINLGGPVTATNSVLTILDNPGTAAARFYRLILLP